jgi:hypothetical protein
MVNTPPEELVWCKASCGRSAHGECFDTWQNHRNSDPQCMYWLVSPLLSVLPPNPPRLPFLVSKQTLTLSSRAPWQPSCTHDLAEPVFSWWTEPSFGLEKLFTPSAHTFDIFCSAHETDLQSFFNPRNHIQRFDFWSSRRGGALDFARFFGPDVHAQTSRDDMGKDVLADDLDLDLLFDQDSRGRIALGTRLRSAVKTPALLDSEVAALMEQEGLQGRSSGRRRRCFLVTFALWIGRAFVCGS